MNPAPTLIAPSLYIERALASAPDTGAWSLALSPGECVSLLVHDVRDAGLLLDEIGGHHTMPGRIRVDGRDVAEEPPSGRRLGIVCARDPLFAHLSVRGNLLFALKVRRIREPERSQRVQRTLALLGLEALADHRPASLDASDTIRAAVARALVGDPAALLLEDPFVGLPQAARRTMLAMLRRLARARGLAMLLTTVERETALLFGERIGIVRSRRLHQIGTAAELLDRPASAFVATGFGEANQLTGNVEWVEDDLARIRLSAGPSLEAMAAEGLEAGAVCTLCVRPERIAIAAATPSDAGDDEALTGTLAEMMHMGDHLRLRFRLAGGGDLMVRRPASHPTAGLRLERQAMLAWPAEHAIAFPFDEADPPRRAVPGSGRVR